MTQHTDAAVLLVAGIGSRLRPLTDTIPKALVQVGSRSILERAVVALREHGIKTFVFATGYCSSAVESVVRGWGIEAHFCRNDRYEATQNSISLGCCEAVLRGKSYFKLDGDLLFDPAVLGRLAQSRLGLSVAVDGIRPLDEEAMKVTLGPLQRVQSFGKGIAVADANGESIGIERLAADAGAVVFRAIAGLEEQGTVDRYYEDVYASLISDGSLQAEAVEVGDLRWTEVDCPEDLVHARALFQD